CLTFLFAPEDKIAEGDDQLNKWQVRIELLIGCLNAHICKQSGTLEEHIDGRVLEKAEKLLEDYFLKTERKLLVLSPPHPVDMEQTMLSCQLESLSVRGESYPWKLFELASSLYGEHDKWFKDNLGFTVCECVEIFKSIREYIEDRIQEKLLNAKKEAKQGVEQLIADGERIQEEEKSKYETSVFCQLFFGKSDDVLSFTCDELSNFSKKNKNICEAFLKRMSQEYGHKNSNFPEGFTDELKAPWDYNSLYERPIIKFQKKYFVPIFSCIPACVMHTFNYDLLKDDAYRDVYAKSKGAWLETRTKDVFLKCFKKAEVFQNPLYTNKNEFSDVLILKDRKIFIIQCKAKQLTYKAKIGQDLRAFKDDLKKALVKSFSQAKEARDYLNSAKHPKIICDRKAISIDRRQVTDIILLSVTLGAFHNIATSLARIDKSLKLFRKKEYPWAISIADLEIVLDLIEYPSQFIHYAKKRLSLGEHRFEIMADEMDLLGMYFCQNLVFNREEFKKTDFISISGLSEDIDRYMVKRYELKQTVEKPCQKMSQEFKQFISALEQLESPYKTNCIMKLLDFNGKARDDFILLANEVKAKVRKQKKMYTGGMFFKEPSFGITFVGMDAENDLFRLFRQVATFSV
ncbi:MAG: hypothetical protein KAT05_03395, partial [Spirochaetes bacterium]|nr:hypothetical protein [Spirochaetota bacterium]